VSIYSSIYTKATGLAQFVDYNRIKKEYAEQFLVHKQRTHTFNHQPLACYTNYA
jgi:hypothetical protein